MWVYISVVNTLSCPNISWTALRSAPPSIRWVANEWRNVCGEISLWIPAAIACFFTILKTEILLIAAHDLFRNRVSANFGEDGSGRTGR